MQYKCLQVLLKIVYSNINLVNIATNSFEHELTEGTDRVLCNSGGLN